MQEKLVAPIAQINERLDRVEKENKRQAEQIDENERYRIRQEIIAFSRDLRDGRLANMSDEDFKHIHKIYDRYVNELGGNSYIIEVMNYIKEQEKQYRNLTKGENN